MASTMSLEGLSSTSAITGSTPASSWYSLRRVELPKDPLPSLDERQRQLDVDEDDEDTQFSVYKSPCTIEVSNDLFTAAEYDEMEICEQTFYANDCSIMEHDNDEPTTPFEVLSNRGDKIQQLNVTFDYELHYDPDANLKRTLASLEATMVQHLAFATRLDECVEEESNETGGGDERLRRQNRRRRKLQDKGGEGSGPSAAFTDTQLSRIEGISSEPIDMQDNDWENCAVIVPGSVARSYTCKPFNGFMTMFIQNDPPLSEVELKSIRIGALRVIRSGMFNNVYVSGNVKKVVFVGRRTDDGLPNVVDNAKQLQEGNDQPPASEGLSGLSISLFAVIAILFLAIIALFVIRRRKKKIAAGGGAAGHPGKGAHNAEIYEQRTVDGSDGEHSPTASADGTRHVYPLPGSLAEQDELALAPSGDYDEVSSLSSASVTPMVRVQPHGRRGQPMSIMQSLSEDTNDKDLVFECCGEDDTPIQVSEPEKSLEDLTILDKFDGDVIRCLNTIAEDSDDEHVILDDSDSLMMVDTQDADGHS